MVCELYLNYISKRVTLLNHVAKKTIDFSLRTGFQNQTTEVARVNDILYLIKVLLF